MTDHGNNEESKSADSKGYLESLSHQDVGIFLNALDLQPGLDNKAGPEYKIIIEERSINGKTFQALARSTDELRKLGINNPFHIDKIQSAIEEINIDMDNIKILTRKHTIIDYIEQNYSHNKDDKKLYTIFKEMLNNESNGNYIFDGLNIGLVPNAFIIFLSIFLLPTTFVNNISLARNKLSSAHIKKFCGILKQKNIVNNSNKKLKVLNLSSNSIRHGGIFYLAKLLDFKYSDLFSELIALNLSKNKIGNKGCSYLAEALINNDKLEMLDLSNQDDTFQSSQGMNEIAVEGIVSISSTLKINQTLKYLDLSYNRIELEGSKWLSNSLLTNNSLKVLKLFYCHCSMEGVSHFGKVLKQNNNIQYLDLRGNGVSKKDNLFLELTLMHSSNNYITLPVPKRHALYLVLLKFCNEGVEDIFIYIIRFLRIERVFLLCA